MKRKFNTHYLIFGFFFVLITGCQQEEIKPQEVNLIPDAFYDLESLESEKAIDLDHDGVFATDILSETNTITEPTFFKNKERYFAELKTVIYNWTDQPRFYDQQIDVWLPYTNVIQDSDGNFLYTDYGFTGLIASYKFDKVKNSIQVISNAGQGAEVISAQLYEDVLTLKIKQYYYTNDWEILNLTGVYKKRK